MQTSLLGNTITERAPRSPDATQPTRRTTARPALTIAIAIVLMLPAACSQEASDNATTTNDPKSTSQPVPSFEEPAPTFPPLSPAPYVLVDQLDTATNQLSVVLASESRAESVDVTGLRIELRCAREFRWLSLSALRVSLLREGCAQLISADPSPAEVLAENIAKSARRGIWLRSATNNGQPTSANNAEPTGPGFIERLTDYAQRNVLNIVGILLALISVPWIVRTIDRWRTRRLRLAIHVILIGAPGAGKSDLWLAWRDGTGPGNLPPTGGESIDIIEPVPYGKYTLYSQLVDASGNEPELALDHLRDTHPSARRVLVVVVSPTRENAVEKGKEVFSADFVAEQRGYMQFPRAIIGVSEKKLRPDLVILFSTKFDLVSPHSPWDSSSAHLCKSVEHKFDEHRHKISQQCEKFGVPYEWIIGSSTKGWGVSHLRDKVSRILTGGDRS